MTGQWTITLVGSGTLSDGAKIVHKIQQCLLDDANNRNIRVPGFVMKTSAVRGSFSISIEGLKTKAEQSKVEDWLRRHKIWESVKLVGNEEAI